MAWCRGSWDHQDLRRIQLPPTGRHDFQQKLHRQVDPRETALRTPEEQMCQFTGNLRDKIPQNPLSTSLMYKKI